MTMHLMRDELAKAIKEEFSFVSASHDSWLKAVDGIIEKMPKSKADWLYQGDDPSDLLAGMHIPCCSQSSGYGSRCHNGPLTGEQIASGDCGEH